MNLTDSQFKAGLSSLPEHLQDQMRYTDNARMYEAIHKIAGKMEGYRKEYDAHIAKLKEFNKNLPIAINATLNGGDIAQALADAGITDTTEVEQRTKVIESTMKQMTEAGIDTKSPDQEALIAAYKDAKTSEDRKAAIDLFREQNESKFTKLMPKEPSRPDNNLQSVDPELRTLMRARTPWRLEQSYKTNPHDTLTRPFYQTARSGFTVYMRNNENVPNVHGDLGRELKFSDAKDSLDLMSGFGELVPTFETLRKSVTELGTNIDLTAEMYKDLSSDPEKWEAFKKEELRPAIADIAKNGKLDEYLSKYNEEQNAMYALGNKKLINAIGGKSKDEFGLMRGWMWQNPFFARMATRGIAQGFSGKDTDDIKKFVEPLLWDMKRYLEEGVRPTASTVDLMHWISTEESGRSFKNRDVLNPTLQPVLDKVAKIMDKVGRGGGKGTFTNFEKARQTLKDEGDTTL
jgi:hypothetical protein